MLKQQVLGGGFQVKAVEENEIGPADALDVLGRELKKVRVDPFRQDREHLDPVTAGLPDEVSEYRKRGDYAHLRRRSAVTGRGGGLVISASDCEKPTQRNDKDGHE